MRGEPHGAQKQDYTEDQLGTDGRSSLEGQSEGGNVESSLNKQEHGPKSHRNDENGGQDVSEDYFHETGAALRRRKEKDNATGDKSECSRAAETRDSAFSTRTSTCRASFSRPSVHASELSANQTNRPQRGSNRWDLRGRTSRWRAGLQQGVQSGFALRDR